MHGVPVEDVKQQELLRALAAFLKQSGSRKFPEWVCTAKLAKRKELARCDENWFYTQPASRALHRYPWGSVAQGHLQDQDMRATSEKRGSTQPLQQGLQEYAWPTASSKL
uniref:Uncharacterized protein n=1 Tax=Ursus maritimus TaxID=29073 RepID=A0A452V6M1_URSMA